MSYDVEFGHTVLRVRQGRVWLLLAVGAIPLGLVLIVSPLSDAFVRSIIGPGVISCGIVCLVFGISRVRRSTIVYERGIVDRDVRLSFGEIEVLTICAVLTSIDGIAAGTDCEVHVVGTNNQRKIAISFKCGQLGYSISAIEEAISLISQRVEYKMMEAIDSGGAIKWGHVWKISRESLIVNDQRWAQLEDISSWGFSEGKFRVERGSESIHMSCQEANFLPGYHVFSRLLAHCDSQSHSRADLQE